MKRFVFERFLVIKVMLIFRICYGLVYYFFLFIYFSMKYLMLLCKGFIIGTAKIIPGVSGAIIAMSFGVYERLVNIMSKPTKIRANDVKFMFFLGIGGVIGIGFFSKFVILCLDSLYFPTMLLFIGLIIGGLTDVLHEIGKCDNKLSKGLIFIICFSLVYYLINIKNINVGLNSPLIYIFMGMVESLTTVIPGISGTAIFMALGWYEKLLAIFEQVISFNFNMHIILFLIGFIISTIMISKLITFLFEKYKPLAYSGVLAFMIASLVIMGEKALVSEFSFLEFILGIIFFIVGFLGTKKINGLFGKFSN